MLEPMKRIIILIALAMLTIGAYAQTDTTKVKMPEVQIDTLDAEDVARMLIGETRDSIRVLMQNAPKGYPDAINVDVYYVYSRREKKNIPLKFKFAPYKDSHLRLYSVDFISRMGENSYGTNDLQTAFWVELIRNPQKHTEE